VRSIREQGEIMKTIYIGSTTEQWETLVKALDTYSRLCIGQLEEVANLVRHGIIPMASPTGDGKRVTASIEVADRIQELMLEAKSILGYSRTGNHGIEHPHVHVSGYRAYKMKKAVAKAIAYNNSLYCECSKFIT